MKKGVLDVITGPMFSGKSEELIKRIQRYKIAKQSIKVFHYFLDNRYSTNSIASHSKLKWKSIPISDPDELLKYVHLKTKIIIIDEVQFFHKNIVNIINNLLDSGKHVIIAGLDTNFRGEPFGSMPQLLALSDGDIIKLKAVCGVCHKWNATRTQRLLPNGQPAPVKDKLIKIGAQDSYQARCKTHHELPQ